MVMKSVKAGDAGRQVEILRVSGALNVLSDSQLLSRYAGGRDGGTEAEAAFTVAIRRVVMPRGVPAVVVMSHSNVGPCKPGQDVSG